MLVRLPRAAWRGLRLAMVCLAGLGAGVVIALGSQLAGRGWRRQRIARWRRRWFRALAWSLDLSVVVECAHAPSGARHDPVIGPGHLVAGNHISWLDIVALGTVAELNFVARADLARWPMAGWLASLADTLFVRRGDAFSTRCVQRRMAVRLRQGESLCFFPEATTHAPGQIGRFHRRLFRPAITAGTSVVPVHIAYEGESRPGCAAFLGRQGLFSHLISVLGEPGLTVRLHPGKAVAAGEQTGERQLAEAVRQRVITLAMPVS